MPRTLSLLMTAVLPLILLPLGCGDDNDDFVTLEPNEREARLQAAQTWMYQLSGLDDPAAVAELAATNYPLLVIEPGYNFRPCSDDFDPENYGIDDEYYDSACADIYPIEEILEELRWAPDGSRTTGRTSGSGGGGASSTSWRVSDSTVSISTGSRPMMTTPYGMPLTKRISMPRRRWCSLSKRSETPAVR